MVYFPEVVILNFCSSSAVKVTYRMICSALLPSVIVPVFHGATVIPKTEILFLPTLSL